MWSRPSREELPLNSVLDLTPLGHPQVDATPLEVAFHYLNGYEEAYVRARRAAKRKASRVVIATASLNGAIAVVGTVIAIAGFAWLGIVSTALAAAGSVLVAWDGHFRYRDLWIQRSLALTQIQALRRTAEFRRARGSDPELLAEHLMREFQAILEEDFAAWSEMRRTRTPSDAGGLARQEQPLEG